jgi:hypothetical protein
MAKMSLARRVRDRFNMHSFSLNLSIFFSAKTIEIDALRFQDKDLNVIGTLEYGQFGVVCLFYMLFCYVLKITYLD